MIGINDIITGILGVIIGTVLIGLVAVPVLNTVLDGMVGDDHGVKILLGIAVMLLCITLIAFPLYMLTKNGKNS